jgi:DNA-directed RNA polymerase specialized sigma24 family protein
VRALLAGGPDDVGQALALLDAGLRQTLGRWLRRRFAALPAEDLEDAWGEALLGLLRAARAGRYDPRRPLLPWLCQFARARAVDRLRRQATRQALLAGLRRRRPRRQRPAFAEAAAGELLGLVGRAVAALPPRQRAVLRAWVEHYPESARREVLRREASRLAGEELTAASAKRALQEGRAKLRAFLRRCGHGPA